MTTATTAITARVSALTPADIDEFARTPDKLLWIEYNVLDYATENGLSSRYATLAEDILYAAHPMLEEVA